MKHVSFLLLILVLNCCVPVTPSTSGNPSRIEYTDKNYVPVVGNVQLIPFGKTTRFSNPITTLGNSFKIQFDLLDEEFRYLQAKIFHCNYNWTPSQLNTLEYLKEYNEFPINKYEFSMNTVIPYVSYELDLPAPIRSGNYIVGIFEENDVLFTRRLMIHETSASVVAEVVRSTGISERNSHHQLEFDITYGNLPLTSPQKDIIPVILQNHNWNNTITGLTPTSSRIDMKFLEYRHFNRENTIPAGNEFRFFNTQTLSYRGLNVEHIYRSSRGIEVNLQPDKPKGGEAYSENFQEDLNGYFVLSNKDPNEMDVQSEYVWVNFTLPSSKTDGQTYVTGRFNNWSFDESNKLFYDDNKMAYRGSVLLKQGYYNYSFQVVGSDHPRNYFEGSHFRTENEYEVLVYFREQGTIFDRLVGYQLIKSSIR